MSTGGCETRVVSLARLGEELAALAPAEVLATEIDGARAIVKDAAHWTGAALTLRPNVKADAKAATRRAKDSADIWAISLKVARSEGRSPAYGGSQP